ncbi:HAMP domain-containing histidine kinase [bacterium]|nr:HAMP domain-containing histidine kinase [bacterium]
MNQNIIKTPLPFPILHQELFKTAEITINIIFHKNNIIYTEFHGLPTLADIKALYPLYFNGIRNHFDGEKPITGVVQLSFIDKIPFLPRKAYADMLTDISKTYPSKAGIIIGANSMSRIGIALIEFFAHFPIKFVLNIQDAVALITAQNPTISLSPDSDLFHDERQIIMQHLSSILWESKTAPPPPSNDESMKKLIAALNTVHQDIQTLSAEQKQCDEKLQKTLLQEQKLVTSRESFISHLSHEVRTPMTGILGMISLAKQTELTKKQSELLENMEKSSKNLLSILDEILHISRIISEKLTPSSESCTIRDFFHRVSNTALHLSIKETTFISKISPSLPDVILCDENMIERILNALLLNAFQNTKEGLVSLAAEKSEDGERIIFTISDSGIGISNDEQKRIFTPFYSIKSEEYHKGNGLGLAIVKNLAELLQGTISLQSTMKKGTTITLTLPLITKEI